MRKLFIKLFIIIFLLNLSISCKFGKSEIKTEVLVGFVQGKVLKNDKQQVLVNDRINTDTLEITKGSLADFQILPAKIKVKFSASEETIFHTEKNRFEMQYGKMDFSFSEKNPIDWEIIIPGFAVIEVKGNHKESADEIGFSIKVPKDKDKFLLEVSDGEVILKPIHPELVKLVTSHYVKKGKKIELSLEKMQSLIINIKNDDFKKSEKEFNWFVENQLSQKEIERARESRKNQVFLTEKDMESGTLEEEIKRQNENRKEFIVKKSVCDSGKEAIRFQLKNGQQKLGLFLSQNSKGYILRTLDNEEELVPTSSILKILYGYKFSDLDCR